MKITVCVRRGTDGELGAFDACAYEAALSIPNSEVTLLSMGPESVKDYLCTLTRLGAKRTVLLSDKSFVGADTIATAYALSCAIKKLQPDMVFCGRQTFVGDTGQVGPMLASLLRIPALTNAMSITADESSVKCTTRTEGDMVAQYPALITVERINKLRLPSIRSKMGEVEVWTAEDIGADRARCGLEGSPTRVISTYKNEGGRRKCKFVSLCDLNEIIEDAKNREIADTKEKTESTEKLSKVLAVGEAPFLMASTVCDNVKIVDCYEPEGLVEIINNEKPQAVIFGSDTKSKRISAETAAILGLGLCADCTKLDTENGELIMYRPAAAGSVIAKINSLTTPAMATVRTEDKSAEDVIVTIGYGAKNYTETVREFARKIGAGIGASRKAVDNDAADYVNQIGLTGKTVSPSVYIAVGVSGAVHHIVGMQSSGVIIAINTDKDAPIFDYADYGIIASAEELSQLI